MKKLREELKIRSIKDALFFGSMTISAILKKRIGQQKIFANKLSKLLSDPNTIDAELKTVNRCLVAINREIASLKELIASAECKPPLTPYRSPDWFMTDEEVVCYIEGEMVPAKIYNSSGKYKDGAVALSVVYDKQIRPEGFLSGYGDIYSVSDPQIIKKWECEYFYQHFCFAKKWAIVAEGMNSGFNASEFITKIFAISCAKGYMNWQTR